MSQVVLQHVDSQGRQGWLCAGDPVKVIRAERVADVLPALRTVEAAVATGLSAAGFVSYEAAPGFDDALVTRLPGALPLLWFGLYREMAFVSPLPAPVGWAESAQPTIPHWKPTVGPKPYHRAIAAIQRYIAAGDTYQVNYTFRLRSSFTGDPWLWFMQLAAAQDAQYSAYLDIGPHVICSVSPELFFRLDGSQIICRPMKGTSPRGLSSVQDRAAARRLQNSIKNRAENAMIVDMMRNDLGRVARPGSVRVASAFDVERYPTLWQMTSTVTAETSAPLADIFAALFPCASITGAPKVRTMQIIAELETEPRGLYTGAIGYMLPAPGRRAQFNVAIRTAVIDRSAGTVEYGVGGGVLADSKAESEYAECRTKARVLAASATKTDPGTAARREPRPPDFELLETMLWTGRRFFLLRRHLRRLFDSADYFGWSIDQSAVVGQIEDYARSLSPGAQRQRVRLLVSRPGNVRFEAQPLERRLTQPGGRRSWTLRLAAEPVDRRDVFLYHKTTRRQVYDEARANLDGCDDVLLWNRRGEITETTIANIVILRNGQLITPAARCGLLSGTFRGALLRARRVTPGIITRADLAQAQRIWAINSVRGWIPVAAVCAGDASVEIRGSS